MIFYMKRFLIMTYKVKVKSQTLIRKRYFISSFIWIVVAGVVSLSPTKEDIKEAPNPINVKRLI